MRGIGHLNVHFYLKIAHLKAVRREIRRAPTKSLLAKSAFIDKIRNIESRLYIIQGCSVQFVTVYVMAVFTCGGGLFVFKLQSKLF